MLIIGILLILLKCIGFKVLAIETGSMGKDYSVGSIVIVDASPPESIEAGDVISFVANEDLVVVTHRVVKIDSENRCFYTKGDENNVIDSVGVKFENLIGKVRYSIPFLGYTIIWAKTTGGKIFIASVLSLIAIGISYNYNGKEHNDGKSKKEKTE